MKFFLYGDHLNPTQLKRRAPEHQFLMLATLPEHTITFCRWSSQWRCGLASVIPSPGEQVWGAIFEVTDEDLKLMDRFEEDIPPSAFRQVQVTVLTEAGEKVLVTTYAATPIGQVQTQSTLSRLGDEGPQVLETARRGHRDMEVVCAAVKQPSADCLIDHKRRTHAEAQISHRRLHQCPSPRPSKTLLRQRRISLSSHGL